MVQLSNDTVRDSIIDSVKKKCFHVIIVTPFWISVAHDVLSILDETELEYSTKLHPNGLVVYLPNGSTISIVEPVEGSLRRRCHRLIVDNSVDRKMVNDVFMPLESLDIKYNSFSRF